MRAVIAALCVAWVVGCGRVSAEGDERGQQQQAQLESCGTIAGLACDGEEICVDDPRDNCPDLGADCAGLCAPKTAKVCGGFAGIACAQGETCVDDPRDQCDPNHGGADCSGLCIAVK